MTRIFEHRARTTTPPLVVSCPHDASERQADQLADIVTRGDSVIDWTSAAISAANVHRQVGGGPAQEDTKFRQLAETPPTEEESEKKREEEQQASYQALQTSAEAVLQTPAGKKLMKKIQSIVAPYAVPLLGVLATQPTKLPLPAIRLDTILQGLSGQLIFEGPLKNPEYIGISLNYEPGTTLPGFSARFGAGGPLDDRRYDVGLSLTSERGAILPGLSGRLAVEGPLDDPRYDVGLSLTSERGAILPGLSGRLAAGGPLDDPRYDVGLSLTSERGAILPGLSVRLAAGGPLGKPQYDVGIALTYEERIEPGPPGRTKGPARPESTMAAIETAREEIAREAAIAYFLAQQPKMPGLHVLVPLKPGEKPKTVESSEQRPDEKNLEDAPLQRQPASATHGAPLDTSGVGAAIANGGHPLDPVVRQTMDARFGFDFGSVRIHDDDAAHRAASSLEASSFTLRENIVFARGKYDPSSLEGRRLIAHELTHVVQQRAGIRRGHLQRQVIPVPLRSSVDLTTLSEEELDDRHALIIEALSEFSQSTPDTALLEEEVGSIGSELTRRRTFSSEAIAKMRDYFVQNARTRKDRCLATLKKGLRIVTAQPELPTTGDTIYKSMEKVAAAGFAGGARDIGFRSKTGRITRGGARPEKLDSSVFEAVLEMNEGDKGWSVFAMGVFSGFHSVTLTLDNSDPACPHLYWSDQYEEKGGWKEYAKKDLDEEVTRMVQDWWDEQLVGAKHGLVVRLWRLRSTPSTSTVEQ
ncbi:eCIS core domain-containing protein [Nocardia sp. bgisy134]|uniref:eCIS core domain-containing protein n=1 Tax=Nocardia sp. bgisy134 TaxID=3413789 RepID=UPI003D743767